ncbi:hypothetical protein RKI04_18030, partial [Citrobacter amalonaticus]|uniref:hypothetical protein n=1 Tax=Citrobacter sp. 70972423 TaxID=3118148 RepID=UPI00287925A6|nr:hypothetical protein [Citrobacter amalonaticus]
FSVFSGQIMINHSQFCFRGIFWLCHKKLHLTQLSVQLLGCSPYIQRGFFYHVILQQQASMRVNAYL